MDADDAKKVARNARTSLEALLRKTRTGYETPRIFEAALWFAATAVGVFLSAGLLGSLAPRPHGPMVFRWVLAVGGIAVLLAGATVAILAARRRVTLERIATLLQAAEPAFRSDITSALQFSRELESGEPRYSVSMAAEHVQRTLRSMLGRVDASGGLGHLLPGRSPRPAVFALAGTLLLSTGMVYLVPNFEARVMGDLLLQVGPLSRPVVGDIDVELRYPNYTGRPSTTQAFSTGNIDTLAGTDITLRTFAMIEAQRFEILLVVDGQELIVPMTGMRDFLDARFVVTKSGTYRFRAYLADGTMVEDGVERTLTVTPDQPPKINITSHAGEIEVSPAEVLEFEFTASDDFGIQSMAKVYGLAGNEPTRVAPSIPALNDRPTEFQGKMRFDLSPLDLQPKDTVIFQIEVQDNNTLTGPGRSLSTEIVLRVASPDEKHQKLIEQQQELVEKLLLLLGDYLETPMGDRVLRNRAWIQQVAPETESRTRKARLTQSLELSGKTANFLAEMATLNEAVAADPLMLERDTMIFSSVHTQLTQLHTTLAETTKRLEPLLSLDGPSVTQLQRLADQHQGFEEAMEKALLRLEDLLAAQKLEMVKATTEEIKALKDRLRELLEKYRDTQDPELKEAIKREINRLRQRMSELMRRMQDQLQKLPEEHVNIDAVKAQQLESDTKKMADAMSSIEEMLDKGDIDGALKALDQIDSSFDELTKQMNEELDKAQPESMSELDKRVSQLMDQVNDLEALQQEVEKQTSDAHQQNLRQMQEKLNDLVQKGTGPILEQLKAQRNELQQMAQRELTDHESEEVAEATKRLDDMERALRSGDVEAALERATQSVQDMRSLQFSMELASRYTKPNTRASKDLEKSRGQLPGMIDRGQEMRDGLEQLKSQARKMLGQPGQQAMQQLGQGQQQVNEQAQKLADEIGKAGDEFPMLGEQMRPAAQKAQQSMEGAEQDIGQGQLQSALDQQRQALEQLRQLKESMRNTLQRQKQNGANGRTTKEKVEIPAQDDRAKETFRDDVMRNMRDGRLENYDEAIRRYYESLME